MVKFKIEDLLYEDLILIDMEADNYEDLIKKIGDIACAKGFVEKDFYKGVIERENVYPTALPTNILKVAIPHAMERNHVVTSSIIVAKLKNPVLFKEMGSNEGTLIPVDIVFMLAVNGSKDQLSILQDLIGMFSDNDSMSQLKNANTAEEVLFTLKKLLS